MDPFHGLPAHPQPESFEITVAKHIALAPAHRFVYSNRGGQVRDHDLPVTHPASRQPHGRIGMNRMVAAELRTGDLGNVAVRGGRRVEQDLHAGDGRFCRGRYEALLAGRERAGAALSSSRSWNRIPPGA